MLNLLQILTGFADEIRRGPAITAECLRMRGIKMQSDERLVAVRECNRLQPWINVPLRRVGHCFILCPVAVADEEISVCVPDPPRRSHPFHARLSRANPVEYFEPVRGLTGCACELGAQLFQITCAQMRQRIWRGIQQPMRAFVCIRRSMLMHAMDRNTG